MTAHELNDAWHRTMMRLHDHPGAVVRRVARLLARIQGPRFKGRLAYEVRERVYERIFED